MKTIVVYEPTNYSANEYQYFLSSYGNTLDDLINNALVTLVDENEEIVDQKELEFMSKNIREDLYNRLVNIWKGKEEEWLDTQEAE
jgi:flagellar biosynthesis chaperone FliJ